MAVKSKSKDVTTTSETVVENPDTGASVVVPGRARGPEFSWTPERQKALVETLKEGTGTGGEIINRLRTNHPNMFVNTEDADLLDVPRLASKINQIRLQVGKRIVELKEEGKDTSKYESLLNVLTTHRATRYGVDVDSLADLI